jgi:hypothetical protein
MRKMTAKLAALAVVIGCGGMLLAQKGREETRGARDPDAKKAPAKKAAVPSLDDLLAEALRNNPDIQVAQAKLHEADAQLNRARLQVMQKIVAYHHNLEAQKAQVVAAEADFRRTKELAEKGLISEHLVHTAAANLTAAKSRLAEIQAELPYLLGKQPVKTAAQSLTELSRLEQLRRFQYLHALSLAQSAWQEKGREDEKASVASALLWLARMQNADASLPSSVADKIRKALDTPVKLQVERISLGEIFLTLLPDQLPNLSFHLVADKQRDIKTQPIELRFKQPIPLGAALQAIQDSVPELRIAVREYGFLVTWADQLPPDAVLVQEFWKGGAGKSSGASRTGKKNPPPHQVSGLVTQVNSTGLMRINVGSDAGLAKGHTLEVFRLKPRPLYLGMIEIIEVSGSHAVGKALGNFKDKLQVGDQVASQILLR